MISPADVDTEKTRLILSHLGRAAEKLKEKDIAKQELKDQIKKLKRTIKSKVYRKEMRELEKKLGNVLEKEEKILRHQKTREAFKRRINEKIDALEKKLTRYIETKKGRDRKIAGLEENIKRRFAIEEKEIEILEEQILNLEKLFKKISGEKAYSKATLGKVRKKIESLKKRLEKIGKK